MYREKPIKNYTGTRNNRLVLLNFIQYDRYISESGRNMAKMRFMAQCDCGNTKEISIPSIVSMPQSCGCWYIDSRKTCSKPKLEKSQRAFNTLLISYKTRAKNKDILFDLSEDLFKSLTSASCYYCGVLPYKYIGKDVVTKTKDRKDGIRTTSYNGKYLYNGIDRLDSKIGYIESNCVPCCEICNKAKRDLSVEEFENWIQRLISHRSSE